MTEPGAKRHGSKIERIEIPQAEPELADACNETRRSETNRGEADCVETQRSTNLWGWTECSTFERRAADLRAETGFRGDTGTATGAGAPQDGAA